LKFILLILILSFSNLWAELITLPKGLQEPELKKIEIDLQKSLLGKKLFFDTNLSADHSVSCASCHDPKSGYTINKAFGQGVHKRIGNLNPPAIFNRYKNGIQFWDGRAKNLNDQIRGPLFADNEMGNLNAKQITDYLNSNSDYVSSFQKTYLQLPNLDLAIDAIIEFEKTILIGNSKFDMYRSGKHDVYNSNEIKGMDLFFNKFKCQTCHSGNNFTNESLEVRCYPKHFINLSTEEKNKLKKIKVPSLRNLGKTWPYLHDGSLNKLEDVIDFYVDTGILDLKANEIKNLVTPSPLEKKQLVAFLRTLDETEQKKGAKKLPRKN